MDNQSIQHTRWNCTYHIVFIPKYRRKIMYGANKKDLVEIIPKLCEMKGISLIEGKVCKDHVHMYVAIPPKLCVLMLSWAVMISLCHAVMRLPGYLSWNVPFDGAAVRPITKGISSCIHALPAL